MVKHRMARPKYTGLTSAPSCFITEDTLCDAAETDALCATAEADALCATVEADALCATSEAYLGLYIGPPSSPFQHADESGPAPLSDWRMTRIPSEARQRIRFLEAECDSLRRKHEKSLQERSRELIDADAAQGILAAEKNFVASERRTLEAERDVFSAKEKALNTQLTEEAKRARKAEEALKKAQVDVTWLKKRHEEASRTFESLLVDIASGLGVPQ